MSWKDHNRANIAVQALLALLEREGIAPGGCLAGSGLDEAELRHNPDCKISDQQEIQITEQALALLPAKAGYGVSIGRSWRINHFGVWGLAILTSPDMRSALEIMSRFSQLSIMLSKVSFRQSAERAAFVVDMGHLPAGIHRFMFERYLSMTANFVREVVPDYDFSDFELQLPFSDPDYEAQLAEITQLKVVPKQAYFSVSVPQALLDTPFPKADPIAHGHFIGECETMLGQYRKLSDYANQIRSYILQQQNFSPRLSQVAKHLCLSERTLRRRLQQEQQSFGQIVLDTKMALAKELLSTTALPVKAVAARLEYSESASFTRAFKKWAGVSPAQVKGL